MTMLRSHRMRLYVGVVALTLVSMSVYGAAHAAALRGGQTYDLPLETTLDGDLYFAGEHLSLEGTTTGDVVAFGSDLTMDGPVTGDLFAAGGVVRGHGSVTGDMRVVAGQVTIEGVVGEDLVVVAGDVHIAPDAVIKGDLMVFAQRLVIEGTVAGNVEAHIHDAEVVGTIGHDATFVASESLALTGSAHVEGMLTYTAPREAFISDGVTIGTGRHFTPLEPTSSSGMGVNILAILAHMFVMMVGALVLLYVFPGFTQRVVTAAVKGRSMTVLKGFLLAFAWPIASMVLCVTVLGLVPGMLFLLSYGIVVFLTMALLPVLAGAVLAHTFKQAPSPRWAWTALGAAALSFVVLLPIIGWLVRMLLFFLVFGTLCHMLYDLITTYRRGEAGGSGVAGTAPDMTQPAEPPVLDHAPEQDNPNV
jgi:cytoskeletal protein CcmA (bactofilin family)